MAATDTEICNIALGLIGADTITDLSDTTDPQKEAVLCRRFYTNARDSLLQTPFPVAGDSWAFAISRILLSASSDTNYTPWTYIYDVPDGTAGSPSCLRSLMLLDSASLYAEVPYVPFVLEGQHLYTELADAALKYVSSHRSATITVTIATPGVVTWTAHGLKANKTVTFTTTGALPTGLTVGTTYYVVGSSITANTFQVSASMGGAAINTTGSQSGVHTAYTEISMTDPFVLALAWRLAALLIKPCNGTSPVEPWAMAGEMLRAAMAADAHGAQEPGLTEPSWSDGRFTQ